jgi:dTMP kinase
MKKLYPGLLVAIEGIDGSGKSLLAHNVYYRLKDLHKQVSLTKEPGGTPFGEKVYTTLINSDFTLSPEAEFLLFAASRAEHFDKVVLPQLHSGSIVISDRMGDSSLVYQGYAKNNDTSMLTTINNWVMHSVQPDITFYVRIDIETALERIKKRNTSLHVFEKERSFLEKTIAGFDALYNGRTDVIIIDGTADPMILAQEAVESIMNYHE